MIALLCTQYSLYEDKLRHKKEMKLVFSLFAFAALNIAEGAGKRKAEYEERKLGCGKFYMRLIHTPVLGPQPTLVGAPCHRQSKSFSFPHSVWPPQSDPSCCLSSKGFLQSNPLRVPLGWPNHAESQPRPRSHLQNKPLVLVHRVDGGFEFSTAKHSGHFELSFEVLNSSKLLLLAEKTSLNQNAFLFTIK